MGDWEPCFFWPCCKPASVACASTWEDPTPLPGRGLFQSPNPLKVAGPRCSLEGREGSTKLPGEVSKTGEAEEKRGERERGQRRKEGVGVGGGQGDGNEGAGVLCSWAVPSPHEGLWAECASLCDTSLPWSCLDSERTGRPLARVSWQPPLLPATHTISY